MKRHLAKPEWEYTPFMKVTDVVCLLVIGWMFYNIWLLQSELPRLIPTHFGLNGNADGYGPKSSIWFLPGITTFFYITTLIARCDARLINIPITVTEQSAPAYFPIALQMLTWMQLTMVSFFGVLVHQIIQISVTHQPGLPLLVAGLLVGSLLTICCVYYVKLNRLKTN